MKIKNFKVIALLCLVFTSLWVVFMVWHGVETGPVETLEKAIDTAANPGWLFYANYLNAVIFTLLCTAVFAGLYVVCKSVDPVLALLGIVFIPVYSVLNLFCYFSQVSIVPTLLSGADPAANPEMLKTLVGQLIQIWEGSLVSFLNGFAYAILGIPSITFGIVLLKMGRYAKISGILLILNATACILGIAGYVMKSSILSMGTVVGGLLFLFSLIFLTLMFSQKVGVSGQTKNTI